MTGVIGRPVVKDHPVFILADYELPIVLIDTVIFFVQVSMVSK